MSMIFEKDPITIETQNTSTVVAYKIRRIEGVLPRGCLPREYLRGGDCLFRINSRRRDGRPGSTGVIVLHEPDDPEAATDVVKIFPGKVFGVEDWNTIMSCIKHAGNRLHDIRNVQRFERRTCTDIV